MTKYFCCCIPVRFGVFVISLLSLCIYSLVAASIWYAIIRPQDIHNFHLAGQSKTAFILIGVEASIVAIVSLLGLIGAIARKRGFISFYSAFLRGTLLAHLGLSIYYIIQIAKHWNDTKEACQQNNNNSQDTSNLCNATPGVKIASIVVFVVALLINLYAVLIVSRYGHQLQEDDTWSSTKHHYAAPVPQNHPALYRMKQNDSAADIPYHSVSTQGDSVVYPYADPQHSFGHHQ